MSKISATKKFILEEFASQRPWIDKLIPNLNLFFEQVYYAIVGGLTLRDNLKAQVSDLQVRTPADPYTMNYRWNLNEPPTEVRVAKFVEDNAAPGTLPSYTFQWDYQDGQITITLSGLDVTKNYKLRLVGQV